MDRPSHTGTDDQGFLEAAPFRRGSTWWYGPTLPPLGIVRGDAPDEGTLELLGAPGPAPPRNAGDRHTRSVGSPRRGAPPRALLLGGRRGIPLGDVANGDDLAVVVYETTGSTRDICRRRTEGVAEDVGGGFLFRGLRRTVADERPLADTDRGRERWPGNRTAPRRYRGIDVLGNRCPRRARATARWALRGVGTGFLARGGDPRDCARCTYSPVGARPPTGPEGLLRAGPPDAPVASLGVRGTARMPVAREAPAAGYDARGAGARRDRLCRLHGV